MKASDTSHHIDGLKPYEEYPYASYVPGRGYGGGQLYKRHIALGHAKNAASGTPGSRLYKFNFQEGEWEEIPLDYNPKKSKK